VPACRHHAILRTSVSGRMPVVEVVWILDLVNLDFPQHSISNSNSEHHKTCSVVRFHVHNDSLS
jgi:hypothetical protein